MEHARRALWEVEGGRQEIDDLKGLLRGTLRIAVTYCFNAGPVPHTLAEFIQAYPGVQIVLTQSTTRGVEEGLINAEFDLGLAFQASPNSLFERKELFEEEIIVVASPDHPLARAKALQFSDLRDVRLALPAQGFSTRQIADAHFARAGIAPQIVLETNDIDVLFAVIKSGAAASIVSMQAAANFKGLCRIPLREQCLSRTASLLWPKGTQLSPIGRRFVEIAIKHLCPSEPHERSRADCDRCSVLQARGDNNGFGLCRKLVSNVAIESPFRKSSEKKYARHPWIKHLPLQMRCETTNDNFELFVS